MPQPYIFCPNVVVGHLVSPGELSLKWNIHDPRKDDALVVRHPPYQASTTAERASTC